jgi:hypothetical protein
MNAGEGCLTNPGCQFRDPGAVGLADLQGEILCSGNMPSIWLHTLILVDIMSMKVFVSVLGHLFAWAVDPNGGILDSHLFFYDRYSDLAEYHRSRRQTAKADRFAAIAEAYYQAAPHDDEPEAAAMAMPVPRTRMNTNAVSTTRVPKPRADEPTSLAPSPAH